MAELRLAGNLISPTSWFDTNWAHLQIVYVDGSTQEEMEVQAPGTILLGDWVYPPFGQDHTTTTNYDVEGAYASTSLDINGRSVDDVWELLENIHGQFTLNGQDINYDSDQNSNSYINTALYMIGIDLNATLLQQVRPEEATSGFPGAETNVILNDETSFDFNLTLTNGNDIIRTGVGNDSITTNGGNDTLTGGAGYDTFVITPDSNTSVTITDFVDSRMDWDGTILEPGDMIDLSAFSNITSLQDLIDLNEGLYGIDVVDEENHLAVTHWNLGNGQTLDFQAIGEWDEFFQDYSYRVYTPQERSIIFYDGEASGGGQDISGTSADDTLLAVSGYDTATGGLGADTFVWTVEAGATGTITDFSSSEGDKIDLAAFTGIEAFNDLIITGGGDTPSISEEPPVAASTLMMIAEEFPEEPAPGDGEPGNGSQYALIELGDGQVLRLEGVDYTELTADDFIFYVDDTPPPVEGVSLFGGNGKDTLTGSEGDDTLDGGNGKDALYAGDGNDILEGGNGNDLLSGGAGMDILTGGNGSDMFVFSSLDHSTNGAADTITDFGKGNDHIDLTGLGFTGIQAGAADGDVLGYTVIDGNTVIEADNSDFSFLLTGDDITLTNDDFVF